MRNYSKINKRKIIFTFLLSINQLILSAYAHNNKKIESGKFDKYYFQPEFKTLISNKSKDEEQSLEKESQRLEKFVEETFDQSNLDNLKKIGETAPLKNDNFDEEKSFFEKTQKEENIVKEKKLNQSNLNKPPLPMRSIISSSEFKVPSIGYVELSGPKVSLNLEESDVIETLKLIGKL